MRPIQTKPLIKNRKPLILAGCKLLFAVCAVVVILLATGCYPVRKMEKQTTRAHGTYPDAFAKLVAGWYPQKTVEERTVTSYLPGRTDTVQNWVTVDCDSVARAQKSKTGPDLRSGDSKAQIARVPCPPSVYRTDTARTVTVRVVQDSLAMAAKNAEANDLRAVIGKQSTLRQAAEQRQKEFRKSRNVWMGIAATLGLLIAAFVAVKVALRKAKPIISNLPTQG